MSNNNNNNNYKNNSKKGIVGLSAAVLVAGGVAGGTALYLNQDEKPVLPSAEVDGQKDEEREKELDKVVADSENTEDESDLADEVLDEKDKPKETVDLRDEIDLILQGETVFEEGSFMEDEQEEHDLLGDYDLVTILEEKQNADVKGTEVAQNTSTEKETTSNADNKLEQGNTSTDENPSNNKGTDSGNTEGNNNNNTEIPSGDKENTGGDSNTGNDTKPTPTPKPDEDKEDNNEGNDKDQGNDDDQDQGQSGNDGNEGDKGDQDGEDVDQDNGNDSDKEDEDQGNGNDSDKEDEDQDNSNDSDKEDEDQDNGNNSDKEDEDQDNGNDSDKEDEDQGNGDESDKEDEDQGNGDESDKEDEDQGNGDESDKEDEDQGNGDESDKEDEDQGKGDESDKEDEDQGNGNDSDKEDEDQGNGDESDKEDEDQGNGNDSDKEDEDLGNGDESDKEEEEDSTVDAGLINIAPFIVGVEDTTIEWGSEIDLLDGITAMDREDGNITGKIEVEGFVDTNKSGSHIITYLVEDSQGAKTKVERVVTVEDNNVPVINGVDDISIQFASDIDLLEGITAKDKEDGNLTDKIEVKGSVDTEKAGDYTISYIVTDSGGVEKIVERTVTVEENNAPEITVESNITIEYESEFNPLDGVTATDKEDGNLTDKIEIVSNTVDTSKVGNFEVVYEVEDNYGKKDTKTLNVTVEVSDAQIEQATKEATESVNNVPNVLDITTELWKDMYTIEMDQVVKPNPAEALVKEFKAESSDYATNHRTTTKNYYLDNHMNWTNETRTAYNAMRIELEHKLNPITAKGHEVLALNKEYAKTFDDSIEQAKKVDNQFRELLASYEETLAESEDKIAKAKELIELAGADSSEINKLEAVISEKVGQYEDTTVEYEFESLFTNVLEDIAKEKDAYYSKGGIGWAIREDTRVQLEGVDTGNRHFTNELPIYVDANGKEYFVTDDNPYQEGDWEGEYTVEEFNSNKNEITSAIETATNSLTQDLINSTLSELESKISEVSGTAAKDNQAFVNAKEEFETQKSNVQSAYDEAKALADKEYTTQEDVNKYAELKSNFDSAKSVASEKYENASLLYDTFETSATNVINTVNNLSTNELATEYDVAVAELDKAKNAIDELIKNGGTEQYASEIKEMEDNHKAALDNLNNMYETYQSDAKAMVNVNDIQENLNTAKASNTELNNGMDVVNGLTDLPNQLEVKEEPEEETEAPVEEDTEEQETETPVEEDTTESDQQVEEEETVEEPTEEPVEEETEEEAGNTTEENTQEEQKEEEK